MKQFCIRLDDKTYEAIMKKSKDKALKPSEYIRRLVDIGLRIESMSEEKLSKNGDNENRFLDLGDSKILWEKELSWTLEMRFLIRLLADKILYGKSQSDENLLHESKVRAENFVSGFLNKAVDKE